MSKPIKTTSHIIRLSSLAISHLSESERLAVLCHQMFDRTGDGLSHLFHAGDGLGDGGHDLAALARGLLDPLHEGGDLHGRVARLLGNAGSPLRGCTQWLCTHLRRPREQRVMALTLIFALPIDDVRAADFTTTVFFKQPL